MEVLLARHFLLLRRSMGGCPIPTPTATLRTLHRFTRRRLLSVFIENQWRRWVKQNICVETDRPRAYDSVLVFNPLVVAITSALPVDFEGRGFSSGMTMVTVFPFGQCV